MTQLAQTQPEAARRVGKLLSHKCDLSGRLNEWLYQTLMAQGQGETIRRKLARQR
jgi:hypothetical protein